MATKRYIVALKEGVDYNTFWSEIENASPEDGFVPSRRVDIVNNRSAYIRLCEYTLSDEEAVTLRKDHRVLSVEQPFRDLPHVKIASHAVVTQNNNFSLTSLPEEAQVNWGLLRHSSSLNPYSKNWGRQVESQYKYALTGKGVDIVINDAGVQPSHPEWREVGSNTSRFKNINWSQYYSGYTDSEYPNDDNQGHGTSVAAIAAGKTYGWAKNAHIYSLAYGDFSGNQQDPLDFFEALVNWHKAKTNNRPTVLNMSWGFVCLLWPEIKKKNADVGPDWRAYITNGSWKGQVFPGWDHKKHPAPGFEKADYYQDRGLLTDLDNESGIDLQGSASRVPFVSDAYNAALAEVIDAGIIVVQAAGNASQVIERYKPGLMDNYAEGDWQNHISLSVYGGTSDKPRFLNPQPLTGRAFYARGFSPADPRVIMVGALAQKGSGGPDTDEGKEIPAGDRQASFSNRGPRIDVYAAGEGILTATSGNASVGSPYAHGKTDEEKAAYKQNLRSGTSYAAPQVAGMIALRLEQQPLPNIMAKTNTETMRTWIVDNSIKGVMFDNSKKVKIQQEYDPVKRLSTGDAIPGSINYKARLALLGAPNRIAYINTTGKEKKETVAGAFKVGESYIIETVGTTDFTKIGAANNKVGTTFTATGTGTGTGTASRIDLPPPVKYRLTVRRDGGEGTGQVTSDPTGITFDSGQVVTYFDFTPETLVTLTSIQSANSVWNGWTGDASTVFVDPMATSVTVKMDQDRTITATFAPESSQILPAGTLISAGCVPGTHLYREVRALGGPAYLNYNVDTPNSTQCGFESDIGITEINYNAARDGDFASFLLNGQFVGWIGNITVDNLKISASEKASFLANTQLVSKIVAIPDYIESLGYDLNKNLYGGTPKREQLISYLTNDGLGELIDKLNEAVDDFIGDTVAMLSLPGGKLIPSSNALIITDGDSLYSRATTPSAQAQFQVRKSQFADAIGQVYPLIREEVYNQSYYWFFEGDILGKYLTEEQLDEIEFRLIEVIDELFVLVSSISDSVDLYGFLKESTAPALPPTAPMIVNIEVSGVTP